MTSVHLHVPFESVTMLAIQVAALRFCERIVRNWQVVLGLLNQHPHKLEEYITLKAEMQSFERNFARATTTKEKLELRSRWERFCAMEAEYEKVTQA